MIKANINLPRNAIYMIHSCPKVEIASCVLVHVDRYGVPRSMMSGNKKEFFHYPDETWLETGMACHMVASHETDFRKISPKRIKQILKHWKRNADIFNNADAAKDTTTCIAWYGGFVYSPQNK